MKKFNLGFMQGRLVKSEKKNAIQFFPERKWKKELDIALENNFKIMEWTINFENIKKNHLFNDVKNDELIFVLKKKKICITSVTCDFFMEKPFFKKKKFYDTLSYLKKVIILSKKIGVKFIVLPLVDNSSIENHYQEKIIIKEIKKFSKILNNDQKILFEIDYRPNKVLSFIKNFGNKFGINYDTGNSACLGYNFDDEKKYFKYVKNIHIKDRNFRGDSVRLGYGNYDFKKFFIYLKKIKYENNLILQTARGKNNLREILINKKFIDKFI